MDLRHRLEEKPSKAAQKVANDVCPKCGEHLYYLGATIGATKLKGCRKCRGVFWNEPNEE